MVDITDIKIRKVESNDPKFKAQVSLTLGDAFAIHDIKIIKGSNDKLFVAMPSRKDANGTYRDIVHPINIQVRNEIEKLILDEYERYLETNGFEK